MDRRVKKNQEAIMRALMSLMAEKKFEKITINEIAERADVNRGTIYSHYSDKYHLLDKCIDLNLEQLIESCMQADETESYPSKASLLHTFEIIEKNAAFYTTLLTDKALSGFRTRLQEIMKIGLQEQIAAHQLKPDMHQDIRVQFLASAVVGVIEWWFAHSTPYTAKDITEQLWKLLELNQMFPPSGAAAGKAEKEILVHLRGPSEAN